ncbi:MAG: DUF3108 domain-containing protein [Pseudomonadota bacterium]
MKRFARHLALIARPCPAAIGALLCLALPALATERATFDVRIAGIRVGYVAYAADSNDTRYGASSEVRSTGLAAAVRPFKFQSRVQGRIVGGTYRPQRYEESADTGARQSQVVIGYRGRTPEVLVARNDQDNATVVPATPQHQTGALDPMTVTFALLRDRPAGPEACTLDIRMFDGIRATRLRVFQSPTPNVCRGVYTRIAGFSPADMAERTSFDMDITLSPAPSGHLQVERVALDTLLGAATLERR